MSAQKITCYLCGGTGIVETRDWIRCSNCEYWPKSYRNKVPCNVCKDTRGHYSSYYNVKCYNCNGTGRDSEKEERELKIIKLNEEEKEKLENDGNKYSETLSINQIKKDLIGHEIEEWRFENLEDFKTFIICSKIVKDDGTLRFKVSLSLRKKDGRSYTSFCDTFIDYILYKNKLEIRPNNSINNSIIK